MERIPNVFSYKPVWKGDRLLIEAVCSICGQTITGSVSETFLQDQVQHLDSHHPNAALFSTPSNTRDLT
jgi:hypothetical protein